LKLHYDESLSNFAVKSNWRRYNEATTPRDASALAYLLRQGASQKVLAEYVNPNLTPMQLEAGAETRSLFSAQPEPFLTQNKP
jgi:hypothetical protein